MAERPLSQQEAAVLAGCSKDTIVRARRAGRFPHARLSGGRWTIPADDLVTAGFCSETGPEMSALGRASVGQAGDRAERVDIELARAQARISALEDVVARQDDELRFLRQLAIGSVARMAS